MVSLADLGEFGLIKRLNKDINIKNPSTVKGVGDDAAVLEYKDKQVIVTTDILVEGVHFDLSYVPLKHLGYKSVVVNLSDVYAMNAVPKQITVTIAISNRFALEAVDELYKGIKLACETYGVDLVGGDTSSSYTGLIISITAIGEGEKDKIVYRSGAKPNDLICVSGDLGSAYAGLKVLQREQEVFKANPDVQPELKGYDYILERQLKPEARGDIVRLFEELKIQPTSMIDISDGLSSEIIHISEESKCGTRIYDEKIPLADETRKFAEEALIVPTTFAMNGGEDYELLFTISQDDFEKIKNNPLISIIGHITEQSKGNFLVMSDGNEIELKAQGWNHNK
ncbi:MAG: thiamine-phosphate kinase [Bacteroidetes bacterium]|nr:MAG: thiamine-phosphate kinase [Bacteroidota bacterium]